MIRRDDDDAYLLIPQHDHALLAGELAAHVGNDRFAPMSRGASSVLGVALHDAGWPLHDDSPTLNKRGLPVDVFESTPELSFKVWALGAERATQRDPYAGLLASLHALSLSVYATGGAPKTHETFDVSDPQRKFELNKFQHKEVERQVYLRKKLGLRVDRPLKHGLSQEVGVDPAEDALLFDFRMLQAIDQISLALCCTRPPSGGTTDVHPRPGEPAVELKLARSSPTSVTVDPWPFDVPSIDVSTSFRRVPGGTYRDNPHLRLIYAEAPEERLSFRVHER